MRALWLTNSYSWREKPEDAAVRKRAFPENIWLSKSVTEAFSGRPGCERRAVTLQISLLRGA